MIRAVCAVPIITVPQGLTINQVRCALLIHSSRPSRLEI